MSVHTIRVMFLLHLSRYEKLRFASSPLRLVFVKPRAVLRMSSDSASRKLRDAEFCLPSGGGVVLLKQHKHASSLLAPAKNHVSFAVRFSEMRTSSSTCGFVFLFFAFCPVVLFERLWISSWQEALLPTQCVIVFVLL